MSKSDIYVPSCHIYVQITLYISKVQYICPKLRYVYPNPATCFRFIYNSQMILHISLQFRYEYYLTDYSIFHAVSISCKSSWPVPHLASMTSRPTCEWTTLQISNMMSFQGVDRPNTTPIGQDRKFKDLKALLWREYIFQRPPFSIWNEGRVYKYFS